jgi:putative transposase
MSTLCGTGTANHGSRKVLTRRGEWATPILFGVLDDRSRLACHLQWYLAETAEIIAHGLSQAFQKRGLPRSALSDNGAAMTAAEITEGLTRLGVLHHTTLPYSPYQNAKQEAFWGPVEGPADRDAGACAGLELGLPERGHPGLGRARVQPQVPRRDRRDAALALPRRTRRHAAVSRQRCAPPRLHAQRSSHPQEERRTIVIEGRRFEVPNRYRHLNRIEVRYANWNLGLVHLVDERTGHVLARLYPQDKTQNASGLRRSLDPVSPASAASEPAPATPASTIPPLLAHLLDRQTAPGLPPAYLPTSEEEEGDDT